MPLLERSSVEESVPTLSEDELDLMLLSKRERKLVLADRCRFKAAKDAGSTDGIVGYGRKWPAAGLKDLRGYCNRKGRKSRFLHVVGLKNRYVLGLLDVLNGKQQCRKDYVLVKMYYFAKGDSTKKFVEWSVRDLLEVAKRYQGGWTYAGVCHLVSLVLHGFHVVPYCPGKILPVKDRQDAPLHGSDGGRSDSDCSFGDEKELEV